MAAKKKTTKKTATKTSATSAKKKATKKVAKKASSSVAKKSKTTAKKAAAKKVTKKTAKKATKKTAKKAAAKKVTKKATKKASPPAKKKVAAPAQKAPAQKASATQAPASRATKGASPDVDKKQTAKKTQKAPASRGKQPVERDPDLDVAQALAALALAIKADNAIILKVTDLTSYADGFVLVDAPSERQVQAIARHVDDEMRKAGKMPVGVEGMDQGHWVLVDFGAVVLHVFLTSARSYYDLEGFWSDAPRIEVDEAYGQAIIKKMRADRAEKQAVAASLEEHGDDDDEVEPVDPDTIGAVVDEDDDE